MNEIRGVRMDEGKIGRSGRFTFSFAVSSRDFVVLVEGEVLMSERWKVIYWCAMGMSFSPMPIAGRGASTVRTPSLLNEDLMLSGLVPFGSKNSRLYSLYTILLSDFSSCFAFTNNLLSTVLTTISSGVYWETSNRSFSIFPSPSF